LKGKLPISTNPSEEAGVAKRKEVGDGLRLAIKEEGRQKSQWALDRRRRITSKRFNSLIKSLILKLLRRQAKGDNEKQPG